MEMDQITAIKKSIEHWDRMIEWAKNLTTSSIPEMAEMEASIKECWHGFHCKLCNKYYKKDNEGHQCDSCPLSTKYGPCDNKDNAYPNNWRKVNLALGWSKWIIEANKFREQLKSLLEETESGGIK